MYECVSFAGSVCCTYGLETAKLQLGKHWAWTNKPCLAVQCKLYRQGEAQTQSFMRKAGPGPKMLLFFVFCFFQKWLCATVNMATTLPASSECWRRELTSACNRLCRHILRGFCTRAGSSPASSEYGQSSLVSLCTRSYRHTQIKGM